MIQMIFGSIWGVVCFILGCVLTFIVCKYYEGLAVEAKVRKAMPPIPPKPRLQGLLDPILPKTVQRPIEFEEEDDDDDEV